MTGLRTGTAIAAVALAATVLSFALEASAKPKKIDSMQVPKGATVQLQSQSAMRMNNSSGESGSFSCLCSGTNHSGTCLLGRGASTIICGVEGSTCEGTCKLYTTSGGLKGGAMMMKRN